jgi:hypothetical protein
MDSDFGFGYSHRHKVRSSVLTPAVGLQWLLHHVLFG